jgi:hypothetical protein
MANLCPIRYGSAVSHTRPRTTILYSEGTDCKSQFGEPERQPREPAQTALQGSRWTRQFERKEEMRPIHRPLSVSSK